MAEEYKEREITMYVNAYNLDITFNFKRDAYCSFKGDCCLRHYKGDALKGGLDPQICWMCQYFIKQNIPELSELLKKESKKKLKELIDNQ